MLTGKLGCKKFDYEVPQYKKVYLQFISIFTVPVHTDFDG